MASDYEIRESSSSDLVAIMELYPAAFPDEELRPLVEALLVEKTGTLSLIACVDETIVGHLLFTICSVSGRYEDVALLGPLAVAPPHRRQGIGSAVVREGLRLLSEDRVVSVYVLGDPAYYNRFGFSPEGKVVPPYILPDDWLGAWQSHSLKKLDRPLGGKLRVPRAWEQPTLWAP